MAKRQSIKVAAVLDRANAALRTQSPTFSPEFRLGIASLLEVILHDTGNYKGFGYLDIGGDESRRCYYS